MATDRRSESSSLRRAARPRFSASPKTSILAALAAAIVAGPALARAAEPAPAQTAELAPSEAEKARGLPIERIVVVGNRRLTPEDLEGHLGHLRSGAPFTPEGLTADVRELWDSGLVDDVEVDLTRGDRGVILRLVVRERPTLEAVEFAGNDELGKDDLLEVVSSELPKGEVMNHAAVSRASDKLLGKYHEEGYFLAEVSSEVIPRKGNRALVRFHVAERHKVKVRRMNFVGNEKVPESDLREAMMTGKSGFLSYLGLDPFGVFRQDVFERDLLMLNALYYDRGYLSIQIGTPRVMMTPDREGVELTIPITEGPRYRIRRLRVREVDDDGREVEPLGGRRHLREMLRPKPGDYFDRAALVKDITGIQTMYRDAGYANVELPPATDLDPERAEVDVDLAVRRRGVVRFGRIEIKGNTKTRDKVIRRELEIREGDLFSETRFERSKARVQSLGFFERVDLTVQQGEDPGTLDVTVEISEKPTGTFQVGAGFSSLESFLLNSQIQQQNLFGRGQALSLNAQISGLRRLLDFRFYEPHLLDTDYSVSVSLYNQLRAYEQFAQTSFGGSLGVGTPLFGDPGLRASLTYTLQWDRVESTPANSLLGTSSAVSVFPSLPLANLFNQGRTSSLRAAVTYDRRDNQLFPTSGYFLQASAELGSRWIGSQNEFIRWGASARFYQPLTSDHSVVLRFNSDAGLVTSPDPRGVPIYARYYLGGITDVRGFPLRSIGPRLPLRAGLDENAPAIPDGANIGGNLSYYQNLEVEFPILKELNVRGVVFTDLGNTWNLEPQYCRAAPASTGVTSPCFGPLDLLSLRTSWGFGVRWLSPMGPLRFEWGFPFKRLPYEQPMDFQFTIGNAF